jgi:archaellum component FlaF (FlaF/FlaG flagellin family)
MGFGDIASALIMVIAAMSIATGVVVSFKGHFDRTTSAVTLTQAEVTSQMRTAVAIEVVRFDNTSNTVYAYVKNTGNERLDPDRIDMYVDKVYIPRNLTNRTVTIIPDTAIVDDTVWDPKEEVEIQVFNYVLTTTHTHELTITTQYGVKDTYTFTI